VLGDGQAGASVDSSSSSNTLKGFSSMVGADACLVALSESPGLSEDASIVHTGLCGVLEVMQTYN